MTPDASRRRPDDAAPGRTLAGRAATRETRMATVSEPAKASGDAPRSHAVRLEELRAFYGKAEQVRGVDLEFH
ncbi:MAG: hypothetical protein QOE27_849, partial [Solirubrobacteraceae bacterium]|nr:hypothetical protein [Solirubrobacteraceae bacterium]